MSRLFFIVVLLLVVDVVHAHASSSRPVFVALTRIKNMNKKLSNKLLLDSAINRCAITCLELPCIECRTDEAAASTLRDAVRDHDAVLLTSPKAAKILADYCDRGELERVQLLSLGAGTSAVLRRAGLSPAFESTAPSAVGLAASLPEALRQSRLLFPASSLADSSLQDALRKRGFAAVSRRNVYSTVNPVWSKSQRLLSESADCVTFTSPSTVAGWVANGGDKALACFVIGEKTRDAAARMGFTNIVHTDLEGGAGRDVVGQMSRRVHNWIARTRA